GDGFDEYVSDPAKPVPFIEAITPQMNIEYMVADQRFASRRPDVLVYQTAELKEDLVLAGPTEVELWVSTTLTDADFIVKLIHFADAQDFQKAMHRVYRSPEYPTSLRLGVLASPRAAVP